MSIAAVARCHQNGCPAQADDCGCGILRAFMSRETPEAAFEHARDAMQRGDLFEVFACLDVNDLKRIASNAVALSLHGGFDNPAPEVQQICDEYGFPLDELVNATRRMLQTPGMEATKSYRDTMTRALAGVSELPSFLAALERHTRRTRGGGSISLSLFQSETLTDVHVDGSRAWGRRVHAPGSSDDIEFARRKGQWYIKLMARPRPSR
jgi:hypothetical protein